MAFLDSMRFQCPNCGQHFDADDEVGGDSLDCPTCQKPFMVPSASAPIAVAPAPALVTHAQPGMVATAPKMSGMAVTSLILGVVGVMGGWFCCGPWLSVLAVIFGHVSFARINNNPQQYAGRGLAVAGLVTGYVGIVLGLVVSLIFGVGTAITGKLLEEMTRVLNAPPGAQ